MSELAALTEAVAKVEKKTDDLSEQVTQMDKKMDVFIARQDKTCEMAGRMRGNHDITLYGDGSNPEHGLVGSHATIKERVKNMGDDLKTLKAACWGLVAAILLAIIGLILSHVMDGASPRTVGPQGNQGNPGLNYFESSPDQYHSRSASVEGPKSVPK